jgi:hypothetical protein
VIRITEFVVAAVAILAATAVALIPNANAGLIYAASFDGASENPPNASPGTGYALVDYDNLAHSLFVHVDFSGLIGTTTASHMHSPAPPGSNAGVATQVPTFSGFPLGVTSGTYDHTFDLTLASSFNPAYITLNGATVAGAEAALAASLAAGTAYLNIHSSVFPAGEIRGNLAAVPVPATVFLLGSGLVGISAFRKRFERGRS